MSPTNRNRRVGDCTSWCVPQQYSDTLEMYLPGLEDSVLARYNQNSRTRTGFGNVEFNSEEIVFHERPHHPGFCLDSSDRLAVALRRTV